MIVNTHKEESKHCSDKHKNKVPLQEKEAILISLPGVNAGRAIDHYNSYTHEDYGNCK